MPKIPIPGYPDNLIMYQVNIAAGAASSEMIATEGYALTGIIMPAAWTAAKIGFAVCVTGNPNDLQQVYSNGGIAETCVAVAAEPIAFPVNDALFFPYLKILSVDATDGTTPANQVAAATLFLLLRKFLS